MSGLLILFGWLVISILIGVFVGRAIDLMGDGEEDE